MKNILKRIVSEPLFHFIIIGMLIFLISGYITKKREDYTIRLDKNIMGKLSLAWKNQYGDLPDKDELEIISDEYIRQEILVREAKALGLDSDDEIIRRRLIQKIEFLEKDNIIIDEPDIEKLEDYYIKNQDKFKEPSKVTFTHIYFNPDNGGIEAAKNKAEQILNSIKSNPGITRAPELGDRFSLLYDYAGIDKMQAVSLLGASRLTDTIFALKENTWSGPFQSGYGWHLIYVTGRSEPEIPELNDIKSKVTESYMEDLTEEKNSEAFDKLFNKYSIEIETD